MANYKTEIKIFVSSTFLDMQIERDVLKKIVQKNLDEKYIEQGISVHFIDLRWGLNQNEEEKSELNVLKVCMEEIKETQPFFLSFLGMRYGWVPKESLVKKACSFMVHDDYKMICGESGISVTEMEILYGAFSKNAMLENCIFCFRDDKSYIGLQGDNTRIYFDDNTRDVPDKLLNLKNKIRTECFRQNKGKIIEYNVPLKDSYQKKLDALTILGEEITNVLCERLDSHLNKNEKEKEVLEIGNVNRYIIHHTFNYVGRKEVEEQIISFLKATTPFIVVKGESGSGKSYLLSHVYSRLLEEERRLLPLFYSTAFNSIKDSAGQVLASWIKQITEQLEISSKYESFPEDTESLLSLFSDLISQSTSSQRKVVVFLDAAENLIDDQMHKSLTFIPDGISVIVSVTDDYKDDYKGFHKGIKYIDIPDFTRIEAEMLLLNQVRKNHFHLSESLLYAILDRRDKNGYAYRMPIWLNLVATLLLNLDSFDFFASKELFLDYEEQAYGKYADFLKYLDRSSLKDPDSFIRQLVQNLPSQAEELFIFIIEKSYSYFGLEFIQKYLSLLSISKFGFSINDFESLYGKDWNLIKFMHVQKWFSSFVYVTNKYGKSSFRHKIISEAILKEQADTITKTRDLYLNIMNEIFKENDSYLHIEPNDIRFTEYVYQLVEAANTTELSIICCETDYSDVIGDFIIDKLLKCSTKVNGKFAPLWYRLTQKSSLSELEEVISKFVNIQYNENEVNDYIWMLCYSVGIRLMKKSQVSTAITFFSILVPFIEKYKEMEDIHSFLFEIQGSQTFHNMLVICYGNLSLLYNETLNYKEALVYLDKRHEAYCRMVSEKRDISSFKSNEARYYWGYAEILYEWVGWKKHTIDYYNRAIKAFSGAEGKEDQYLYLNLWVKALIKMFTFHKKKNNVEEAKKLVYKACLVGESCFNLAHKSHTTYEYLREYFVSIETFVDFCKKTHTDASEYSSLVSLAWNRIQEYYPSQLSDSNFRIFYMFFKEEMNKNDVPQESENIAQNLDMLFNRGIESYRNKQKNQAIRTFCQAAEIAERILSMSHNYYIKEKLSQIYYYLGFLYSTKSDKEKYGSLSEENLKKAIDLGNNEAYTILAHNSEENGDFSQAKIYLAQGAQAGAVNCCERYAIYLLEEGDYESGSELLKIAVDGNSLAASLHFAIFTFNGEYGFKMDKQAAIEILTEYVDKTQEEIAKDILRKAVYYADEYFGFGLDYKLPHLHYINNK